jgi:hypothetical protein
MTRRIQERQPEAGGEFLPRSGLVQGLFRALNWGLRKADGCDLYTDMYDTYGAQASWQAHRVAHPEAVREDAAQRGRVLRACGDL